MKHVDSESPSDVAHWMRSESADLWPALLGSLSLRRSPCIRENCPACRSGEQHPSYVLCGRLRGRRLSVYVPQELVEEVQRCLDKVVLSRSCCMRRHHATSKELVTRTRGDLRRGLKKPDTGRSGMAPQEVLRSLVLMRVKNWDYRELSERIADGYTLRLFTG